MRKQVYGRKFKRDKNQRKALFSGLISSMIIKGRLETTEERAKAIKGDLEKLVTKAKKGNKAILRKSLKPFEAEKLLNNIAPVFKDRNGGYTRLIKTGKRLSDNAQMAILEWTQEIPKYEKPAITKAHRSPQKTLRKRSVRSVEKSVSSVSAGKASKRTSSAGKSSTKTKTTKKGKGK